MLKSTDLKKLDIKAIEDKVVELRNELFDLKVQKATSSVENSHMLKACRKDIARLLTEQSVRKGN